MINMVEIFDELGYKKQTCKTCGQEFYSKLKEKLVEMLHVMSMSLLQIQQQINHTIYMKSRKFSENF